MFQSTITKKFVSESNKFSGVRDIHFAAPSLWLRNLALESKLLGGRNVRVIRNPIPEIYSKSIAKSKLNQKEFRIVLGFVSVDIHNPYKGLEVFVETLRILASRGVVHNFRVNVIGRGSITEIENIVETKQLFARSDGEMVQALNEIDYLVVPSNSDNLPSVIGEALMSGTRVIGSNTGGIPEVLRIVGGDIFGIGDSRELADLIEAKIQGEINELHLDEVREIFSTQSIGAEYRKYYEEITHK